VSIDQKSTSRNPRSTVGTITEVYDYLRLLYARVGEPHCPNCGRPISRQTPQQIVDRVLAMAEGTRFQVLAPVVRARKGEYVDLPEGDEHRERTFSEHLACTYCDLSFEAMEPRSFSFNSPFGACPECTGIGTKKEVDPDLIVPDVERTLREGAIAPWAGGHTLEYFLRLLEALGESEGFDLDTPWRALSARAQKAIMHGSEDQVHVRYRNKYGRERSYYTGFEGVVQWIERRHTDTDSDWSREKYEGFMRDVACAACGGARLKAAVLAVTLEGHSIAEL